MFRYKLKYKKAGVLPIMKSKIKDKKSKKTPFMFLSDEGPTLKMLDFTFHIGSTPTFLYFNLYFLTKNSVIKILSIKCA